MRVIVNVSRQRSIRRFTFGAPAQRPKNKRPSAFRELVFPRESIIKTGFCNYFSQLSSSDRPGNVENELMRESDPGNLFKNFNAPVFPEVDASRERDRIFSRFRKLPPENIRTNLYPVQQSRLSKLSEMYRSFVFRF